MIAFPEPLKNPYLVPNIRPCDVSGFRPVDYDPPMDQIVGHQFRLRIVALVAWDVTRAHSNEP